MPIQDRPVSDLHANSLIPEELRESEKLRAGSSNSKPRRESTTLSAR
jgi:hypothetical protein